MKKALFGLLLCALSVLPVGIEKLSASVTPSFDNGATVEKCWYGRGYFGRGSYGYRGGWGSNYSYGYGYPYSSYSYGGYGGCSDCGSCGGYGYGYGYNSGCGCGCFGSWW